TPCRGAACRLADRSWARRCPRRTVRAWPRRSRESRYSPATTPSKPRKGAQISRRHTRASADKLQGRPGETLARHTRADAWIGQTLEKHRVALAAADHVNLADCAGERIEAALHLGDPPLGDDAGLDEVLRVGGRQRANELPVGGTHAVDVGQEHQLLG